MTKFICNRTHSAFLAVLFIMLSASPAWAQEFEPTQEQKDRMALQIEQTSERLQLTDEQAVEVSAILSESFTERLTIMDSYGIYPNDPNFERPSMRTLRKLRKEMKNLDKETHEQLSAHLTEEQMDTWKDLEAERRERMRN